MSKRTLKSSEAAKARIQDEAERRAKEFVAVGLQAQQANLSRNRDIEVRHAMRNHVDGARRVDVFDALKADLAKKAPGAYDAARRLEQDMAERRGEGERGQPGARVDNASAPDRTMRMLLAADRVVAALSRVGARDAWLLTELIEGPADREFVIRDKRGGESDRLTGWRATVAYITAETDPMAQGAVVRSACANLAAAYRPQRAA